MNRLAIVAVPAVACLVLAAVQAGTDGPRGVDPGVSAPSEVALPPAPLAGGPDMTFCQYFGLKMFSDGRIDDVCGLAVGTTAWNVGTKDLKWFGIPDEEHPFIVSNMYRLVDDRLEQIGQSHAKHGFFALPGEQCDGPPCTFEAGHAAGDWLGTGCTDTYSANLNGLQSGLGPRYEINPWTGGWTYPGSHMQGAHEHDGIQHRLQVHDGDIDPALNPGALYFVEGYYVIGDDIAAMNNASWKQVTVFGDPGSIWGFTMDGADIAPNIGFALDAWDGATQTLIAQQLPVREFLSPDGRAMLAAKATPVNETTWHYEYALLNIDMDRQIGSFSVPVGAGITVSNVGFHAVEHHDEPVNAVADDAVAIDNAPWTWEVASGAVTWQTDTNPLRWGTMYNFRFDADAPPETITAMVGHFRAGTPETLPAETVGPMLGCPADIDGSGEIGFEDLLAVLSLWGPCPGCPEDVDGDDLVGFNDLLMVLSTWGPCP